MGASQTKPMKTHTIRANMFRATNNNRNRALYFAYGSNLNLQQMLGSRCPHATPLFKARLKDWKLTFRGCADVEHAPGESVVGGVFEITPHCESKLDLYEGYPSLYTKATSQITLENGKTETVMFYTMASQRYESGPGDNYFDTILTGYEDFKMSESEFDALIAAAERADAAELEFRRNNPHLVRNSRGRYVQRERIRQYAPKCDVQPYSPGDVAAFLREYGIDAADLDDDLNLSDLIGDLEREAASPRQFERWCD